MSLDTLYDLSMFKPIFKTILYYLFYRCEHGSVARWSSLLKMTQLQMMALVLTLFILTAMLSVFTEWNRGPGRLPLSLTFVLFGLCFPWCLTMTVLTSFKAACLVLGIPLCPGTAVGWV